MTWDWQESCFISADIFSKPAHRLLRRTTFIILKGLVPSLYRQPVFKRNVSETHHDTYAMIQLSFRYTMLAFYSYLLKQIIPLVNLKTLNDKVLAHFLSISYGFAGLSVVWCCYNKMGPNPETNWYIGLSTQTPE